MASILKREGKPKPWFVYWREPGTKTQHAKAYAKKGDAEAWRDQVSQDLRDGTYVSPRPKPFNEWAKDWKARRAPTVSPNTAALYEWAITKYLVPAFGDTPIQNLKPERIERWQAGLLAGGTVSPRTVQMVRGVLGTILQDAYDKDYLKRNPFEKVTSLQKVVEDAKRKLRYLTLEQVKILCEKAGPFFGTLFLLMASTGLRIGEALGLQWADLDLERARLVVRRQVVWRRKKDRQAEEPPWMFRAPKSKAGRRMVEIPPPVIRFLLEHRTALNGSPNPHGLVFPNADGTPFDDGNVRRRHFKPALAAIHESGIRQHDFRRTFIAMHVQAGTHVKQVQTRVGHSKIALTMDVYGELAGEQPLAVEQASRLAALVATATPDPGKHAVSVSTQNTPKLTGTV